MKKAFVILPLILILSNIFFVTAQTPSGLDTEELKNDNVVRGVQQLQNFTDKGNLENIGEGWKNFFLNNTAIAKADSIAKKGNWAFLFLFARDYELSLALFIAVLFWVVTFLVLPRYFVFLKEKWMRYAGSFGATAIISQMQIFNSVSNLLIRLFFYKVGWWWKTITFLFVLILLILYFGFLRYFGKIIEANKKKKEEKRLEISEKKINIVADELSDAAK